jgi:hypothetical protein
MGRRSCILPLALAHATVHHACVSRHKSRERLDEVAIDLDAFDRITADEHGLHDDASRARALGMDHAIFTRLRDPEQPSTPGNKFIARTLGLGIPFSAVFYPRPKQEA